MMRLLGKRPSKNGRACGNMEANDLKQHEASRGESRMLQVRFDKDVEYQALRQCEEIIGQKTIEDNLPLCKWACEKEFNVRRLEDQTALKKALEESAADHQQRAANQGFGPDELGESAGMP